MSESLNPSRRLRYVYVKRGNKIEEGVLAKSLIRRIQVGDLTGSDKISGDGIHWARLDEHPQLIPYFKEPRWESDYLEPLQAEPEEISSTDDEWFQRVFSSPLYDSGQDTVSPFGFYSESRLRPFFNPAPAGPDAKVNGANWANGTSGNNGFQGGEGGKGAVADPAKHRNDALESEPAGEVDFSPEPLPAKEPAFVSGEKAQASGDKQDPEPAAISPETGSAAPLAPSRWVLPGALILILVGGVSTYFPAVWMWAELAAALVLAGFAIGWICRWEKRQQALLAEVDKLEGEFPHLVASEFCGRVSEKSIRDGLQTQLSLHYAGARKNKRKKR